jgi:hypothetical protein
VADQQLIGGAHERAVLLDVTHPQSPLDHLPAPTAVTPLPSHHAPR